MKFRTKQKRLVAIVDAWQSLHRRPFTMDEVSEWAMRRGLYPVPARGCSQEEAEAWEAKLKEAARKGP